ncbi:MAG: PTS sugar transporter subunit IIA [Planctomycetes bacterium]|nr:PTS sugar transporter subunit IIA [Planctomycetota bacterium]
MPSLSVTLTPEQLVDLDSADRDEVLRAMAEVAARDAGLEPERLLKAILDREALLSTGFGGGAAMPHVRLQGVRKFHTVLGRARRGVEFAAADEQPVHMLLLIVGPEADRDGYKKLMAKGARFLKQEYATLLEAPDLAACLLERVQEY